jgi:hypothetical protein
LTVGASQTIGTYLMPRVLALCSKLPSNWLKSSSKLHE